MIPVGDLKKTGQCHDSNGNRSTSERGAAGSSLVATKLERENSRGTSHSRNGEDSLLSPATRPYIHMARKCLNSFLAKTPSSPLPRGHTYGSEMSKLILVLYSLDVASYHLGDWKNFQRELMKSLQRHDDLVNILEEIVRMVPTDCQFRLDSKPFFSFKDKIVEMGWREVTAARMSQEYSSKSQIFLYFFLLVFTIYGFATCDVDKEIHRRSWTILEALCSTFLVMIPACIWGIKWTLREIRDALRSNDSHEVLYSMSSKANTHWRVSDWHHTYIYAMNF